ncbi:hypothetical protein GCM10010174_69560 [Kutzneria viridogrisea]|uniref:Glycosyl hydrolase family 2 n=1 Tax=Kutzneria viridogrisea TaxID=47990 RepID=A0ABR6BB11_9PSEU|nr:hypothetical protein [Kutzneria viridogrisea]
MIVHPSVPLSTCVLTVLLAQPVLAAPVQLTTPWTTQVDQNNPLPEYPRPQLVRQDWLSLNGRWQFAPATQGQAPPIGTSLPDAVTVPYPVESLLSGHRRHEDRMWYRRLFTVPANWSGQHVWLNFGAVDWDSTVWVNGTQVGTHRGGYDSFRFDISPALHAGENELVVGVHDPVDAGDGPIGKQRLNPDQFYKYTAASGIWQTVWLEPTPAQSVAGLDLVPDVPAGVLRVTVRTDQTGGVPVRVSSAASGTSVSGAAFQQLLLPIPNARLWSPEDPYLYDLTVTAGSDTVTSYFGMRGIGVQRVAGAPRPVLNGRFTFQVGALDQGYWPDGIYTAPTDEALRYDLEQQKQLGFTMVRKHMKVEPQRWYYWADKLGLLVWQDMPAMDEEKPPSSTARAQFETELHAMVDQHRNSPSIIAWVNQNEGWGQFDQARLATAVKSWDPSRLVDNMSGINCCGSVDGGNGDLADVHVYVGPGSPGHGGRAGVLGEFGGLGLVVPGHVWDPARTVSYEMQPDAAALTRRYTGLMSDMIGWMRARALGASVFTQVTDVESEVNGLLTYDRRAVKGDPAAIRAANQRVLAASQWLNTPESLQIGRRVSLRVTTPGFTDRYVRHQFGLGVTSVVNGASSPLDKQDASFTVRPGLANPDCYSLQSVNFPGAYLRHSQFRLHLDDNNGTPLFAADATFCLLPGLSGHDVSLQSGNFPDHLLRHINAEVWIAGLGGGGAQDNPAHYEEDTTFAVEDAWSARS